MPQNQVDEQTIRLTLDAFEQTMARTNAAIQSVDSVSSSVPWQGVAANQYRTALSEWTGGVRKVQSGLEMLRSAMTSHLNVSTNAEDEAASMAKWY